MSDVIKIVVEWLIYGDIICIVFIKDSSIIYFLSGVLRIYLCDIG